MNRLKNTRCYLAGAIEKESYSGSQWREKVKSDLSNLGIHWLDPTKKPTTVGIEDSETALSLRRARNDLNGTLVKSLMKPIRHVDLRMIDISDFVIVRIEPSLPTFGTHEEVDRAINQNKPVLIMVEGGLEVAPFWWFDKVDLTLLFGNWSNLYTYLDVVAHSSCKDISIMEESNWQWIFFDWMGE